MNIRQTALDALCTHARAGHPFEVCGVLLGHAASARRLVLRAEPMENTEPEHPRVRYRIDPGQLLRLDQEAATEGLEIVGYYHSHPDHPARPSETDRRIAKEGLSDGVVHVVVGVTAAGAAEPTAWLFRDALAAFVEEPLDVEADGPLERRPSWP